MVTGDTFEWNALWGNCWVTRHGGLVAKTWRCWAQVRRFGPNSSDCSPDEGEKRQPSCVNISAHVKDPEMVKISPEPFAMASFIA